jgi:putative Ca2+/H+ antiporter (TMEM165/GDT1 family)
MLLIALGVAFVLIFLSEMGDKTQLLAVSMASRYNHKTIFLAVSSAVIVATAIGVTLGLVIFSFIPILWIRVAASILFIIFGIWTLIEREEEEEEEGEIKSNQNIFSKAFSLTFVVEMGDKTQLTAIALTASYGAPVEVFIGAALGFVFVTAIGVWLGKWLGDRLEQRVLTLFGGVLFIAIGIFILIESLFF